MSTYERLARPMSTLQRRISTALLAVIVLFVAAQGLLAYSSLEEQEDELVDDIVLSETRRLVTRMTEGDRTLLISPSPVRLAPNMRAWLLPPGSADVTTSLPPYLRGLGEGPHRLHEGENVLHAVIQQTEAGRLHVVFDATRNEQFVYDFGLYLIAMGLGIIAVGWLVSVWVARIVVSPIRRLAERLAQWTPGATTRSASQSDEEALLLQAFDQAQRKLDEAIAHEREFAANIRHEVRTPLAALRSDAEMLLLTAPQDAAARERLQRMMATVDAMADSVESTWSLSRSRPAQPEPLDLHDCVDGAWASLQHLNREGRVRLVNRLEAAAPPVELDRQALMTILRNLMRNAIEHAAAGACEVRRTPVGIEVADEGRGIASDDLPHVFQRYFRGRLADTAPGPGENPGGERGLGLAIARQTALQQGWSLTVRSVAGEGTVFRLDFQT